MKHHDSYQMTKEERTLRGIVNEEVEDAGKLP